MHARTSSEQVKQTKHSTNDGSAVRRGRHGMGLTTQSRYRHTSGRTTPSKRSRRCVDQPQCLLATKRGPPRSMSFQRARFAAYRISRPLIEGRGACGLFFWGGVSRWMTPASPSKAEIFDKSICPLYRAPSTEITPRKGTHACPWWCERRPRARPGSKRAVGTRPALSDTSAGRFCGPA
jgi:hypothetical protein